MIVSNRLRIVYQPVPKNACTTIKTMVFHADAGRPFDIAAQSSAPDGHIHHIYPTMPADPAKLVRYDRYDMIVVLRDPLERFISGYRNRIATYRDILHTTRARPDAAKMLEEAGLPAVPDINTFAARLPFYMRVCGTTAHHFRPQAAYVSAALPLAGRPRRMEDLPEIAALLSERAGFEIPLPKLQTAGNTLPVDPLTEANLATLRRFYAADWDLLAQG
ncbi:sulfotransferase family protein [Roseomonas sp. HJA6]|uniref:Sulfotransferase family protein n=1 Tax=Roseomonas alba TaxID=2846776 RepID=A0ABS7A654_9PROT|nr:sulfotransferase family protein [Neoroseomonas alba]